MLKQLCSKLNRIHKLKMRKILSLEETGQIEFILGVTSVLLQLKKVLDI